MKLTSLELSWLLFDKEESVDIIENEDKWALTCLQPPQTLTSLTVNYWNGVSFPSWEITNIVSISISDCCRCQHLPTFSGLHHLRVLRLCRLRALEYIENISYSSVVSSTSEALNFPSLELHELTHMPELQGWSRVEEDNSDLQKPIIFHRLSELHIFDCPRLVSFPLVVPRLVSLFLGEIDEGLRERLLAAKD